MQNRGRTCRALTLVELITALAVVAIISVAVTSLLVGASETNTYANGQGVATSQVELAFRRITYNLRMASALTTPSTTTAGSTLTLVTQPDASNGNATYTVTYTLTGTNLTENDSRYNGAGGVANVLVSNVSAFTVTRLSLTSPTKVTVTLTVSASTPVSRSATIYCRNF